MLISTCTITIGRNVGDQPMSDRAWSQFRADVSQLFVELYTEAAGRGEWDGVVEESAAFVGTTHFGRPDLVLVLGVIAERYGQEAVGLVYQPGTDTLVEARGLTAAA